MNGDEPKAITISLTTLRAELAAQRAELEKQLLGLELRLTQSLASRADLDHVKTEVDLLKKTALIQGGPMYDDLREAQTNILNIQHKIENMVNEKRVREIIRDQVVTELDNSRNKLWTGRNRLIAVGMFLAAVVSIAVNIGLHFV